jgi:hypothetical protein
MLAIASLAGDAEPIGPLVNDLYLNENIKTRAAWLYYMEGMTQDQVARELGLQRTRVLRMLAAAREDGTVQIRVTSKLSRCVSLERALERRYGLERAIVIPQPRDDTATAALIGATLGAYVEQSLAGNLTIGLGWGRTLSAATSEYRPDQPAWSWRGISAGRPDQGFRLQSFGVRLALRRSFERGVLPDGRTGLRPRCRHPRCLAEAFRHPGDRAEGDASGHGDCKRG